jgi:hypothetical protein
MPLSLLLCLSDVDLSFDCPHCGHALIKPGRWFKSVTRFKCKGCDADVRLTYSAKVALFERHANLADTATPSQKGLSPSASRGCGIGYVACKGDLD